MARLSTNISGDLKDLESIIVKQLFNRSKIEQMRRRVVPVVQEEINNAVTRSKDFFNPLREGGDELVGELGIGKGGREDSQKLNNAWKLLLIDPNSSVAKLSTSFQPRNFKRFGVITYEVNKELFYTQRDTTYRAQRARQSTETVEWMRNFIDGIVVRDHEFVDAGDPEYRDNRSRTGLGHMISMPGRQFTYPGVGERATFGRLLDNVSKTLSSNQFKNKVAAAIAAALGG